MPEQNTVIRKQNRSEFFIHCEKCSQERPAHKSPEEWAKTIRRNNT